MGSERISRLDIEPESPARDDEVAAPVRMGPGKRTQVERFGHAEEPAETKLGFEDYRVLGLRDVLQAIEPEPQRLRAVLDAADGRVARRAATAERGPESAALAAYGRAMWRAAERHAATLYRSAAEAGEVDEQDPAIGDALEQRGAGAPLPEELRGAMERELGVSLARVRVHTDAVAAQAALAARAEAFTVGEDIFFAQSAFAPETRTGRKLIAHELAHVAQALRGRAEAARRGVRISEPGEALERDAVAVADRVGSSPAPSDPFGMRGLVSQLGGRIGRWLGFDRANAGSVRAQVAAVIQRKTAGAIAAAEAAAAMRASLERTSDGQPLPEAVRRRMERVLGADFSAVRVHEGSQALAVGALAYTRGTDIYFAPGQYDPTSRRGLELLGHELAHVVQQARGRARPTAHLGEVGIDDDGALEREADELGAQAAADEDPTGTGATASPDVAATASPAVTALARAPMSPALFAITPNVGAMQPIQRKVGANLRIGDPVIITIDPSQIELRSDEDPHENVAMPDELRGEICWGAEGDAAHTEGTDVADGRPVYRAGYWVEYEIDGEPITSFFLVDELDYASGHDYETRGDDDIPAHQIPFTKDNLTQASKRKPKPRGTATKPKPLTATQVRQETKTTEAQDALRQMPRGEAGKRASLKRKRGELTAHLENEIRISAQEYKEDGQSIFGELPESYVSTEIQGTATVGASAATVVFFPSTGSVLPPGRKAWEGDDVKQLELEVSSPGIREYNAKGDLGEGEEELVLRIDARGATGSVQPVDCKPIKGRIEWSGDLATPVTLMTGKGKTAVSYLITIASVVKETFHCRDEDGVFFTVTRDGASARLTQRVDRLSSGGGGGGFATTRTDLAATDSYVWFGPEAPKDAKGGVAALLAAGQRRGSYEEGIAHGDCLVEWAEKEKAFLAFHRTNTPLGSEYLYFKRGQRHLRWFGDPRSGMPIGLRLPDYGGAYTDDVDAARVSREMAKVADPLAKVGDHNVPKGVSVWLLKADTPPPKLFSDANIDTEGHAALTRLDTYSDDETKKKKNKGNDIRWNQEEQSWSKAGEPLPDGEKTSGWISRKNPNDRGEMMEGAGATAEARKSKEAGGLGAGLEHPRQEWCHLVGHGDGGPEAAWNLVAGTHYANTEQLAMETGLRVLRKAGGKRVQVLLKVTVYLEPGTTNVARTIRYKVYLARVEARKIAQEEQILDHVYDGQSESFDRNEFEILKVTLEQRGFALMRTWGMKVDEAKARAEVDAEMEAETEADEKGGGADGGAGADAIKLRGHQIQQPAVDHRLLAPGQQFRSWDTRGANNCAFHAFSLVLTGLVNQGAVPQDRALAGLGDRVEGERFAQLVALSGHAATNSAAALAIQIALAHPLRQIACDALAARPVLQETIKENFVDETRRRVLQRLGVEVGAATTDLFENAGSPVVTRMNSFVDQIYEAVKVDGDLPAEALRPQAVDDLWEAMWEQTVRDWIEGEGITTYIAFMRHDQVWGGAPELSAICDHFGVHFVLFSGRPVRAQEGRALAGAVPICYRTTVEGIDGEVSLGDEGDPWFTQTDFEELRAAELIEAEGLNENAPAIHFKLNPRQFVLDQLVGNPDLCARFLALYDAHYKYRQVGNDAGGMDEPRPTLVGMHQSGSHWSAMTHAQGGYDLRGGGAYLDAAPAEAPVFPEGWDLAPAGRAARPAQRPASSSTSGMPSGLLSKAGAPTKPPAPKPTWDKTQYDGTTLPNTAFVGGDVAAGVKTTYRNHRYGEALNHDGSVYTLLDLNALGLDPMVDTKIGLVNAAASALMGGGGVDGAIHRVAGQAALDKEVRAWKRLTGNTHLAAGHAMTTSGGKIKHDIDTIFHAVGPNLALKEPIDLLDSCCNEILAQAQIKGLTAIVFCNISSALFGFDSGDTANRIHAAIGKQLSVLGYAPKIILNGFPPPGMTAAGPVMSAVEVAPPSTEMDVEATAAPMTDPATAPDVMSTEPTGRDIDRTHGVKRRKVAHDGSFVGTRLDEDLQESGEGAPLGGPPPSPPTVGLTPESAQKRRKLAEGVVVVTKVHDHHADDLKHVTRTAAPDARVPDLDPNTIEGLDPRELAELAFMLGHVGRVDHGHGGAGVDEDMKFDEEGADEPGSPGHGPGG